jgi:hypothetical protein
VDGFATRLAVARALTPAVVFERLVLRQTAPELLDARSEDAAEPAAR